MDSAQPYSRLDCAFAHFLSEKSLLSQHDKNIFEDLLKQLSAYQSLGHSCLFMTPEQQAVVEASALLSDSQNDKPLVLEDNRLYTHRYWFYEQRLAAQLHQRCRPYDDHPELETTLDRYFEPIKEKTDWQRLAAENAVRQQFSIITGGPGTGKTTTVVKILAILQELHPHPLHIALTAPTGKAAMRLQESILGNKTALACSDPIKNAIPEQVSTIHRLLGALPPTPYFKHHAKNPLTHDLVVVDEASMVDLALMSKLVDALKPGARLILLGDQNQLASVESGAVLADLTAALPEQTTELQKAHRFVPEIKQLASLINQQQSGQAWEQLQRNIPATSLYKENLSEYIADRYQPYFDLLENATDPEVLFSAFNQFKILCANRSGPFSVSEINHFLEHRMVKRFGLGSAQQWYVGKPIMITTNYPPLKLANGDIGICLPDPAHNNAFMIYFQRADHSIQKVPPGRLPRYETVYAMTIHKSQGSEFDNVLIVLPEKTNPILTKELLYTAITRAKKTVTLFSSAAIFEHTVANRVMRHSGLAEKLCALKSSA